MPICIPKDLPAKATLESENIFVMDRERASHQDIRPLRALIFNLMPTKIATETQLLRLIGNSPLQIEVDLLQTASYSPKNAPPGHLERFYTTFEEIKNNFYDAMIITGAPVENLEFSDVAYWDEICGIMDWAKEHVFSALYICWAAQAALYHMYGVQKRPLPQKRFGVFESRVLEHNNPLLRGFNDTYFVPHSHHTDVPLENLAGIGKMKPICASDAAGPDIVAAADFRRIFVFGHMEYDTETLKNEYFRDIAAGKPITVPVNYFPGDDPQKPPINRWRAHANLFFSNWMNLVYQLTPFDLSKGFEK